MTEALPFGRGPEPSQPASPGRPGREAQELRGAGVAGGPARARGSTYPSRQPPRTCAKTFSKGFVCLKQGTSENHSNISMLSAGTCRTEVRTRGNWGSKLLGEPSVSPPLTDVGTTGRLRRHTRATDNWPGTSHPHPEASSRVGGQDR